MASSWISIGLCQTLIFKTLTALFTVECMSEHCQISLMSPLSLWWNVELCRSNAGLHLDDNCEVVGYNILKAYWLQCFQVFLICRHVLMYRAVPKMYK